MTFVKRSLSFQIQLQGDTFDGGATTLSIEGIRSRATMQSWIGGNTAYGGHAVIQLWGMNPSDMAKLSIIGFTASKIGRNLITVLAGDETSGNYSEVFSGNIFAADIDYNAMPDVSITLSCSSSLDQQVQKADSTSVPGAGDVATMLQGICASCSPPLKFINNGVSAVLSNPAHWGSPEQQIREICISAGIPYKMEPGGTLQIWPRDQPIDNQTILMGPEQGMVGYPRYSGLGLDVTMEFSPSVQIGRQMQLVQFESKYPIPGVPGTFWINSVSHDLSAELPGGPWFTMVGLSNTQVYAFS